MNWISQAEDFLLVNGEDLQVFLFFSFLLLMLVLERLWPRRQPAGSQIKRWRTNAVLTVLAILTLPLVPVSFLTASVWAQSQDIGLLNTTLVDLPLWLIVGGTLLLRGFISFATHFLNHQIPWLWRLHRVHHMDTELDVSSTVRFHPLEMPVSSVIGVPMVVLFGLSPWVLLFYELLDAIVTLFSHSNLRVPRALNRWLRYVIVTPDLHRVHHSSFQPETDSNYSAVFPVWDIAFGTFKTQTKQPQETMPLGLEDYRGDETTDVAKLLLSPFRSRPAMVEQG